MRHVTSKKENFIVKMEMLSQKLDDFLDRHSIEEGKPDTIGKIVCVSLLVVGLFRYIPLMVSRCWFALPLSVMAAMWLFPAWCTAHEGCVSVVLLCSLLTVAFRTAFLMIFDEDAVLPL